MFDFSAKNTPGGVLSDIKVSSPYSVTLSKPGKNIEVEELRIIIWQKVSEVENKRAWNYVMKIFTSTR